MAKLTPNEVAQKAALRGDIETALAELHALQATGNVGANVSLAEIAAFKGQWAVVQQYALKVIASHIAIRLLNIYQDMVMLAARAGTELGAWSEIQRVGTTAADELAQRKILPGFPIAARTLAEFAASVGQGSISLVKAVHADAPVEQRKAKFHGAIETLAKEKKPRFKTPEDRANHLFGLARVCDYYQGAVELYDKEPLPTIFDNVVFAASGLARYGRTEDAWHAIETKLHSWWPIDETQIAPVALLTDEALRSLMTPARCEAVLRTKRGAEALVK